MRLSDERTREGATAAPVPAVVRVRLPRPIAPAEVEAVLVRAIASTDPPMTAEVVWIPMLGATRAAHRHPELTYALVIESVTGAESDDRVLRTAKRAARKALRRVFGSRSEVAVRRAHAPEEVATCLRAMIGNPRDAQP